MAPGPASPACLATRLPPAPAPSPPGNFELLARRFPFARFSSVGDLGGSAGALALAVAAQHPHLAATTYDLPPVHAAASRAVRAAGLEARVAVRAGGGGTGAGGEAGSEGVASPAWHTRATRARRTARPRATPTRHTRARVQACRVQEAGRSALVPPTRPQVADLDFFGPKPLPLGHDVLTLGMVLHDWGLPRKMGLLRKARGPAPRHMRAPPGTRPSATAVHSCARGLAAPAPRTGPAASFLAPQACASPQHCGPLPPARPLHRPSRRCPPAARSSPSTTL